MKTGLNIDGPLKLVRLRIQLAQAVEEHGWIEFFSALVDNLREDEAAAVKAGDSYKAEECRSLVLKMLMAKGTCWNGAKR